MAKTTLLVDGDIILYKVAVHCEIVTDWGNDFFTLHADLQQAKEEVDVALSDLMTELNGVEMIISLSSPNNFRKDVLPSYKYNRKRTRKPVIFPPLKDYLREVYEVVEFDGLEGDDVIGILGTGYKELKGVPVLVSTDKDMKTIPCRLYNPEKSELGIVERSQEEADYYHLYQTLTGDATDGYKGCPGVGPKSAERLLINPVWDTVKTTYENNGLTEEDALVQARVARILRCSDFDRKKKEVILWNP